MREVVIVSAVRTAIGAFNGSLVPLSAVELGSLVIDEAIHRAGISKNVIDEVIMGNVLRAGLGQNPARQAAVHSGLLVEVSSLTIAKGVKGISAFILEKGMSGFTFGKKEHKMGIHSSATAELIFQNVQVPKENLMGKEGDGFKIAMSALDGGRIGVAAQAIGIAQSALEHSIKYSKERAQFGKPIASNQGIGFT